MRPSQLDVNLLSNTNCNLSNSISLCRKTETQQGEDDREPADLYIDQLVDINGGLIQICCNVKRLLIRQWHCLCEAITAEADDMIKIDSDPIKIDDVIGRITEMDGPDNHQLKAALEQVQTALADQQTQIRCHDDQMKCLKELNGELCRRIEATVD